MTTGDIALKFIWPPAEANADMRTLQIKQIDESGKAHDIYKVLNLFPWGPLSPIVIEDALLASSFITLN
jgi:hypothetical protein